MSQPIEPEPGAPVDTPPEPGAPTDAPSTTPPVEPSDLPDDPQALKAEIARLRKENGAARTGAKTKAAADARAELVKEFADKLGLADTTPDPDALVRQLSESQQDAALVALEHQTYRAAVRIGGPELADRLLDSISFRDQVDAIDGDDFETQLVALIQAEADRAGTKPRTPAPDPTQGARGGTAAPDLDAQIKEAQSKGDYKAVIRLNGQKMAAAKKK